MGTPAETVNVGRVGPAHGVRGEVFVEPWTDDPDDRFAPGAVLTDPAGSGLEVVGARYQGARLVVHFAGVDDRGAAEALRGTVLAVPVTDRAPLTDPDAFYDSDLIGLRAVTVSGDELGPVVDVRHTGAQDQLVVDIAGRSCLVPFVSAIVPRVDVPAGVVEVDPPEGLFDL